MRSGWDRVTRWAGIGNNREDAAEAADGDAMQDDVMNDQRADGRAPGAIDRVEAGMEGHENAAAHPVEVEAGPTELEQVRGERDQLLDRLARLQAEFDNARKREAKERQDTREYAIGNAIEPFLGVMDNFSLALKAEGTAEQLRSGVGLILKQMEDALKSLQVTAVETVGTQFDPRIHEALGSIETVEFPDHQVLEEIRRGYKVRERLLRPAMVRIAENKAVVSE